MAIDGHERHNHGATAVYQHHQAQIPAVTRQSAVGIFVKLDGGGKHLSKVIGKRIKEKGEKRKENVFLVRKSAEVRKSERL